MSTVATVAPPFEMSFLLFSHDAYILCGQLPALRIHVTYHYHYTITKESFTNTILSQIAQMLLFHHDEIQDDERYPLSLTEIDKTEEEPPA